MKTMRLAILFSGNGSNLENIYTKMQDFCFEIKGDSSDFACEFGDSKISNSCDFTKISVSKTCDSSDFCGDSSDSSKTCDSSGDSKNNADSANFAQSQKIKLTFPIAISSKKSAFGIKRCERLGLKCEIVDFKDNKNAFENIMEILCKNSIDLVILAGFMKILPPAFNAKFRSINIHPSILPLFKGANAIKESFESDMKIAGVSVHFVSDELDSGALIMQEVIYKIDNESLESFENRIHNLEHTIYPKAIIKAISILKKAHQ